MYEKQQKKWYGTGWDNSWKSQATQRSERRKFAEVIIDKLESIASNQCAVMERISNLEHEVQHAIRRSDVSVQHSIPSEPIVTHGTTWYVEIPRFEYVERVIEVPRVKFMETVLQQTFDVPGSPELVAHEGESIGADKDSGDDNMQECAPYGEATENVKETQGAIDALITSIQTEVGLLRDDNNEAQYIELVLNTFQQHILDCKSTFPNPNKTKLSRSECEQRFECMHRYSLWRKVCDKFHNGTGDPLSKTDAFLELMYKLHKLWQR